MDAPSAMFDQAYRWLDESWCLFAHIANSSENYFTWLSRLIRDNPELRYAKSVYEHVCKEADQNVCIGEFMETNSRYFSASMPTAERRAATREMLILSGRIDSSERCLVTAAVLDFGRIYSRYPITLLGLESDIRANMKHVVSEFVRDFHRETFLVTFLENNPAHTLLRDLIHDIYIESMWEGEDNEKWKNLTVEQKFGRILYHPLWTRKEDGRLLKALVQMSGSGALQSSFKMEAACVNLHTLMGGDSMGYSLEAVRRRLAMWCRLFFKFVDFTDKPGIHFDWDSSMLMSISGTYLATTSENTLLSSYFRSHLLPWHQELKIIFDDEYASVDVFPDVSEYIYWDMLMSEVQDAD